MLAKDGTFVERKLAAILAADVAGYSRLMEISYKRGGRFAFLESMRIRSPRSSRRT